MIGHQESIRRYYFSTRHHLRLAGRRLLGTAPLQLAVYFVLMPLCFAIESLPGFIALAEPAPTANVHQTVDANKPARTRSKIVGNSSDGPTIHFSQCRENDKQHVSCQMTDADGKQHWVYLAGYKLPAAK
jgi:hypothetical protein